MSRFEETQAECYVVVAEWAQQGPIVMETEGDTSMAAAMERGAKMAKTHGFLRWCVCKLTCAHGNPLVLMDLARFQPQADRSQRRTYPVSGDEEVKF